MRDVFAYLSLFFNIDEKSFCRAVNEREISELLRLIARAVNPDILADAAVYSIKLRLYSEYILEISAGNLRVAMYFPKNNYGRELYLSTTYLNLDHVKHLTRKLGFVSEADWAVMIVDTVVRLGICLDCAPERVANIDLLSAPASLRLNIDVPDYCFWRLIKSIKEAAEDEGFFVYSKAFPSIVNIDNMRIFAWDCNPLDKTPWIALSSVRYAAAEATLFVSIFDLDLDAYNIIVAEEPFEEARQVLVLNVNFDRSIQLVPSYLILDFEKPVSAIYSELDMEAATGIKSLDMETIGIKLMQKLLKKVKVRVKPRSREAHSIKKILRVLNLL